MSEQLEALTDQQAAWIRQQHLFFVSTAPLAESGRINCSPKGLDTFRIISPREVAYLDLTGSGVETIAHLQENGRIVLLFCAFEGPPKLLRIHGRGQVHLAGTEEFQRYQSSFQPMPGSRSVISVEVTHVSESCGFGVPLHRYEGDRPTLTQWAEQKGEAGVQQYQAENNRHSIDGLIGLP